MNKKDKLKKMRTIKSQKGKIKIKCNKQKI